MCVSVSGNKNGVHIFQFVMHFSATFVATTIMNNSSSLTLSLSLCLSSYSHVMGACRLCVHLPVLTYVYISLRQL